MTMRLMVLAIMPFVTAMQNTDRADLSDRVRALVRKLDDDSFRVRRNAFNELTAIGPAALEHLPLPKDAASFHVRVMLDRLRFELEIRRARSSLSPSLVTLGGEQTLDQLVARISEQTRNPVSVARLPARVRGTRHDVKFQNTPFWTAIDDVAKLYGVHPILSGGTLRFRSGPQTARRCFRDAFRLRSGHARLKDLIGVSPKSLVRIPLQFDAEPRLRLLMIKARGSDLVARAGERVFPAYSPDRSLELLVAGRGETAQWTHDVLVPGDSPPPELEVKGQVRAVVATGYERFEFTDLREPPVVKRSGGVSLQLHAVDLRPESGNLTIEMTVAWQRDANAFDSYRTWVFHNEAWLQTASGKRVDFSGPIRTEPRPGGTVRLRYEFRNVPVSLADCRFIYDAPTSLENILVPVSLSGIKVRPPGN